MGVFGPVQINQPIEIEINLMSGPKRYKSRVEGISGDYLTIGTPIVRGALIPISTGTELLVSYLDDTAIYTFNSVVLAKELEPVPTLTLDKPYNIKRDQRRNFVRLDTKLSITYSVLKDEECDKSNIFSATTTDISGGGLKFHTENSFELNDKLKISLLIPDNSKSGLKIETVGKVIRVTEKRQDDKKKFLIGVEFQDIKEGQRDKIVRYIFNRQMELRKKGLV